MTSSVILRALNLICHDHSMMSTVMDRTMELDGLEAENVTPVCADDQPIFLIVERWSSSLCLGELLV